jgi:hypothetical protein
MNCAFAIVFALFSANVTLDQIKTSARVYLRDSAEVPMSVDVTTVVTDPGGKVKHRGHLTAGMVFKGYNLKEGKFSLDATKGGLTPFGLMDSLSGDMATFFGGSTLFWAEDSTFDVQQSGGPGRPVIVMVRKANCPAMELSPKYMFPRHPCGAMQVALTAGDGGDLAIQHVGFDSTGGPAEAKIAHLGTAQLQAFHFGVEFQLKFLPGEAKPYLWPLKTVVTATTDKGNVTITNLYSAKR